MRLIIIVSLHRYWKDTQLEKMTLLDNIMGIIID